MNHEQMIKEARTIEAMKKGYIGLEGKFSIIAKRLGEPLIKQSGMYLEASYLDLENTYEAEEVKENEYPTMDEFDQSYEVGLQFDGLSRGINMTISVQHYLREIVVRYQGVIVYREVAGELEGYVPGKEWEDKIVDLYSSAIIREKAAKPTEKKRAIEENQNKKQQILKYLQQKWGLQ